MKPTKPLSRKQHKPISKAQSTSLAEQIAVELLTPAGGPECHRLQIMQRVDGTEKNMGGYGKNAIISIISQALRRQKTSKGA